MVNDMPKNVTIYLPEKVVKRMDEFREVNWSQVCRVAVEQYIEDRYNINPKARVKFLELENKEKADGRSYGSKITEELTTTISYMEIQILLKEINERTTLGFSENDDIIDAWINPPFGFNEQTDELDTYTKFLKEAQVKGSLPWLLKTFSNKEEFHKNWIFVLGMLEAIKEVFK